MYSATKRKQVMLAIANISATYPVTAAFATTASPEEGRVSREPVIAEIVVFERNTDLVGKANSASLG